MRFSRSLGYSSYSQDLLESGSKVLNSLRGEFKSTAYIGGHVREMIEQCDKIKIPPVEFKEQMGDLESYMGKLDRASPIHCL